MRVIQERSPRLPAWPTVGASGFSQDAGTFNGGDNQMDVNGPFSIAGGTFNAPTGTLFVGSTYTHNSGGTFNHNNGTVIFDGNGSNLVLSAAGESFFNLSFNSNPGQVKNIFTGPVTVQGSLALNDGFINTIAAGLLRPEGNMVVASTFDGGNTAVTFAGASDQTFSNNGGANPTGTWTVNKTGGAVTLLTDLILGATQSLNITSSALHHGKLRQYSLRAD